MGSLHRSQLRQTHLLAEGQGGDPLIVIPAAGAGKRFAEAGYEGPKHLLDLGGKTMIERVIENVRPLDPFGEVIVADQALVGETRGAVETVLRAAGAGDDRLVIANCDQLIKLPELYDWEGYDTVYTFRSANPAHSYVTTVSLARITSIREKQVISDRAVSGVYCFRRNGKRFLEACERVLEDFRPDQELYLSAALQQMLDWGLVLYAEDAPTAILGTPEDFSRFEVALSLCAS